MHINVSALPILQSRDYLALNLSNLAEICGDNTPILYSRTRSLCTFLVGVEGAASILGISVTAFKALDRCGQIGPLPVELGTCRRRLYSVCELRRWAEAGCQGREKWVGMKS